MVSQTFEFQLNLLKYLNAENTVISPLSIFTALAMTANGAKGSTQECMISTLQGSSMDEINKQCSKAIALAETVTNDTLIFRIANSIFTKVEPKESFKIKSQNNYKALISKLISEQQVNEWVSNMTNNKIKSIDIPSNVLIALINVVYFYGKWKTPFDEKLTKDGIFFDSSNQEMKCKMMFQKSKSHSYYQDDHVQVIDLPYSNNISALVILPISMSLGSYISQLKDGDIKGYINNLSPNAVVLELPRFKLECNLNLVDCFNSLGMGHCFNSCADFSEISEGLLISDIQHKTFIEVNESGTEAAAVTGVMMTRMMIMYNSMIVNKPFLFIIRSKELDQFMFIAKVDKLD